MTFTKLASSITESTIWDYDSDVRIVWITMLAMADFEGRVMASVPGLAHRARVPIAKVREALLLFAGPDPDSRTKDDEGRRVREIDGGWFLVNHAKHRARQDESARRAYKTQKQQEYRARSASPMASVDIGGQPWTHTDTDTDTESESESEMPAVVALKKKRTTGVLLSLGTKALETKAPPPLRGASVSKTDAAMDEAWMIARAVAEETSITTRWAMDQLVQQARLELREHAGELDAIRDGMVGAWKEYCACAKQGKLRTTPTSPEKFYGEGKWKSSKLWGLKTGMRAYEDSGAANVACA